MIYTFFENPMLLLRSLRNPYCASRESRSWYTNHKILCQICIPHRNTNLTSTYLRELWSLRLEVNDTSSPGYFSSQGLVRQWLKDILEDLIRIFRSMIRVNSDYKSLDSWSNTFRHISNKYTIPINLSSSWIQVRSYFEYSNWERKQCLGSELFTCLRPCFISSWLVLLMTVPSTITKSCAL